VGFSRSKPPGNTTRFQSPSRAADGTTNPAGSESMRPSRQRLARRPSSAEVGGVDIEERLDLRVAKIKHR